MTAAPNPSIQPWLDDAGLDRYAFRILATISRRAGRNGSCYETVANMAARCRMSKSSAQRALRHLTETGLIRVTQPATPNSATHYALTKKLHLNGDLLALFVPAALDDSAITPEAFRLYCHYVRWAWDGEVSANHARAARTCGTGLTSRASAVKFESELCAAGLLKQCERAGKHSVFAIGTRPTVHEMRPVAEAPTAEPFTRYTPTVHEIHPKVFMKVL